MDPEFEGYVDREPRYDEDSFLRDRPESEDYADYESDSEGLSDEELLDELQRQISDGDVDAEADENLLGDEELDSGEVVEALESAVQQMISGGLQGNGQQYLQGLLDRVDPYEALAMTQHPLTRDLLLRAARDFERENSYSMAPRFESSYSEGSGGLSGDERREVARFEREFGIRADRGLIAEARRIRSRGY